MKLLFLFALPLMFGNVFQQMYTVVDTAIVGRGVGMTALAALGTVDWLNWMMLGITQGFTQGFSVRISQKYGEGDQEGLKRMVAQSARLAILIAVICTIAGQVFLPGFLRMLRVPENLLGMASLYSRIVFAGIPAVMFYNYCAAVLRAIGDSKTPLKAMVTAAITNIILDVIAVFGLKLGIGGAAIATVLSQCLSGGICVGKIIRTPELHFGREEWKKEWTIEKNLIKIGTPAAMKNIIISVGGMIVQSIVNGFGMSFIAGFTATNKLYGLLETAAISYGYAVTTYVGQNYGAKKTERIQKGVNAAVILAVGTSLIIAGLMFLFGRPITMLFISAKSVELVKAAGDTAYLFLCVMSAFLPVLYLLYVFLSALQGMGNTVIPMISGIVELVIRVGVSAIVGITGYANGIFAAEVLAWIGAAGYLFVNYYKMINEKKISIQE